MNTEKFAGIDIGSNAARLIIKNVLPGKDYKDAIFYKLVYLRLPFRLGGDVFKYGYITEKKVAYFINGLKIYKKLLDYYEIEPSKIRACATSATRDAENGRKIIEKVKNKIGLNIDIIDGNEEAELIFKTNIYNLPDGKTFLSADLGGGSLQLSIFEDKNLLWSHSYKIGTVRILNNVVDAVEYDAFKKKMYEIKKQYPDIHIIGSGGNINKMSKMIGEKKIELKDIKELHQKLSKLSIDERIKKYKLRSDRADVIVPAAEIYITLLSILEKQKIYVPKVGLADGIIRELYEKFYG